MLHYADEPYRFFAPKPNRLVQWIAAQVNRRRVLPCQQKIARVEVSCPDTVRTAWRKGDRLLFVPNHPSHSDPQTMFESFRQLGIHSMFMAAYDTFFASKRRTWLLRRCGVFSVDRESSDKPSVKQAVRTLVQGRYALTIFAEGNVYLQNDLVTPFHEGAFFIAWKAWQELQSRKDPADVWICPVSLKFTHMHDARPHIVAMLEEAAQTLGTTFDKNTSHLEEVRRIGLAALRRTLQQRAIPMAEDDDRPLPDQIQSAADAFLTSLEQKIGLEQKSDSPMERVRRIRRAVHDIRTDPNREADHEIASTWAIEAMTALRIVSYSGHYLDHPTVDRFAETAEKLLEDIYSRMGIPYSDHCAYVRMAEPIRLSERVDGTPGKPRQIVEKLARECEAAVQAGIDVTNRSNPHPGAQPY